ncbi:PAS domain S-box protein [Desulfurispirillum indicum]|uniref:PAS sensor protein n=1 Tax=Desulfurispirillum indicum (strain ATCC BAA-1389 / DSM 22839 / S5) TaxID=653733 RepID=E6W5P3_DESIS|nr:PAS domain S-box protein [Desulfurispirillum indicum]ADU66074.1 PAS sensor protein [Desulfurispirillum indicum S5]UCZ55480.1 PAS domain S-box protein [Desulfurispirillum indicum]
MSRDNRFQQLVEQAGDAILASDRAGNIVLWNASAGRIFGFSETEALGQSLDIIIPERFRQRHWEGYHQTMATGITRYGTTVLRVPAIDQKGRALSIAFTVVVLSNECGTPEAIGAIVRDETERWAEEIQMRQELTRLKQEGKPGGACGLSL